MPSRASHDAPPPEPPVFEPSPLDAWPDEIDEVLLTQVEFAERVKRSTRQIHNMADVGMPVVMRGDQRMYPWPRALHWMIERKIAEGVRAGLKREIGARRAMGFGGEDAAPGAPAPRPPTAYRAPRRCWPRGRGR
jgi:hypothetical protein